MTAVPPEDQPSVAHADAPSAQPRCPNCDQVMRDRYCDSCGQDNRHARLSMLKIIASGFEELTELETPVIRTVIGLTIHPGRVCLDYVQGRRRRYMGPFKYYLVCGAIWLLTLSILGVSPADSFNTVVGQPGAGASNDAATDGLAMQSEIVTEQARGFADTVAANSHLITLTIMPLMAMVLHLLFLSNRYNLAEHCVFKLYSSGQQMLLSVIPLGLGAFESIWGMAFVIAVGPIAYDIWAGRRFYRRSIWATSWRMMLIKIIETVFVAGAVVIVLLILLVTGRLGDDTDAAAQLSDHQQTTNVAALTPTITVSCNRRSIHNPSQRRLAMPSSVRWPASPSWGDPTWASRAC